MNQINIFRHSSNAYDVAAGDVLFREGDHGDVMFAVVDGSVDLLLGDRVLETVESGGIIGELAIIEPAPRSATAVAATPARIVPVDQREFTYLVQEHPTFALQVMRTMASRLRRTNEGLSSPD